jgi:hypothetical protein
MGDIGNRDGAPAGDARRRDFVRTAVLGAAFAAPLIQSTTARAQNGLNGQTGTRYYTIDARAVTRNSVRFGIGGTISPNGVFQVPAGSNVQLTVTTFADWYWLDLTIDGLSTPIPVDNTVELNNVQANHVVVTFVPEDV